MPQPEFKCTNSFKDVALDTHKGSDHIIVVLQCLDYVSTSRSDDLTHLSIKNLQNQARRNAVGGYHEHRESGLE